MKLLVCLQLSIHSNILGTLKLLQNISIHTVAEMCLALIHSNSLRLMLPYEFSTGILLKQINKQEFLWHLQIISRNATTTIRLKVFIFLNPATWCEMPYFTTPLGLKCEAIPAASQNKTSLSMHSTCYWSTEPEEKVKVRYRSTKQNKDTLY